MKKLSFILLSAFLLFCCKGKKEIDPNLYEEGREVAKDRINRIYEENAQEFLMGTNKNENVSTSIKDTILIVKIIGREGANYNSLVEFYHDLALKNSVRITGTQLQDSITGEILARCGYGFDALIEK